MGGGYIQLIARGEEDLHLIGNPQITFFKTVYRQYTNFSMELIENDIDNSISTGDFKGNFKIKRSGDLLYKTHLEIDLPNIKVCSKKCEFINSDNKKNIGFPDISRTVFNGELDDLLVDSLPIVGEENILYSYGTLNKNHLQGKYYNIIEGTSRNHDYNNSYLHNRIMYDYDYKWPKVSGELYSGGKPRITFSQLGPEFSGKTDYHHHDYILNGINISEPNISAFKNFEQITGTSVERAAAGVLRGNNNFYLEYDELYYDLFYKDKIISIYTTDTVKITTSQAGGYSKYFFDNPPWVDVINLENDIGITSIEETWHIDETTPLYPISTTQLELYTNGVNPRPHGMVFKSKTQITTITPTNVRNRFTEYIHDRFYWILLNIKINEKYKLLTKRQVIGLVYNGLLRTLPTDNSIWTDIPKRKIICDEVRFIKKNMNGLFESILNKIDAGNVYNIHKQLSNNNYYTYTNNVGHALIKNIEFKIGNQLIDKQSGEWLNVYNGLHDTNDTEHAMIGKWEHLPQHQNPVQQKLYIPLQFYFCKDVGNALPMISLQYHDVDINIDFRALRKLIIGSNYEGYNNNLSFMGNNNMKLNSLSNSGKNIIPDYLDYGDEEYSIKLWSNFIFLDNDERKRFAKTSHEYLIEQVQTIKTKFENNINIPFRHGVKTLYWVIQNNTVVQESENNDKINYYLNGSGDGMLQNKSNISNGRIETTSRIIRKTRESPLWENKNDYFNYDTESLNNPSYYNHHISYEHFDKCSILFNGQERLTESSPTYYRVVQPYNNGMKVSREKIYTYSFSLKPNEYQPSGACNFSKIDNATMEFTGELEENYLITIFAVNYNILRIMSGMGGLLYS